MIRSKQKKNLIKITIMLMAIISLVSGIKSFADSEMPQSVVINTNKRIIDTIRYDNYVIEVERMVSDIGVGYCLEIEKDYPKGQIFELVGVTSPKLNQILANGYPAKSAVELGVDSDDEAYFATQIVVWSMYEGYDVNKYYEASPKVLAAIKSIYNKSNNIERTNLQMATSEYYYNDATQKVAIVAGYSINNTLPEVPSGK